MTPKKHEQEQRQEQKQEQEQGQRQRISLQSSPGGILLFVSKISGEVCDAYLVK